MKKIIVFGATGNVGYYFTKYASEYFSKDEYQIIASGKRKKADVFQTMDVPYISVDITNPSDFDNLPKEDIYAVVLLAAVILTLVNLFATQANAEIIATGSKFLTIVSPFYFFVCIKIVIDGGVRGCGVMTPFMISTFLDLALRVIFAYILSPFFGSDGIWLSWPVGWVLALAVDLFFYNYYIRKGKAFSL